MILDFPYLNSLDWVVDEDFDNLEFNAECEDYFLSMYSLLKKDFFGGIKDRVPFLSVTHKKTNICVYRTSENILKLWNNLIKWFEYERKELFKKVENL